MFRLCGLRFALCPRGFSRFAASDESSTPLLIGLTSRCFAHRARASCAPRHCHPYQFPLKSYGFSGAETARKRFLLWKMGFSSAKIAPSPPYTPPGTIEARKGSVPQGARFVRFLNSQWSFHCARKLACGTPLLIGLTTACFRHWRRPSCAPAVHAAGDDFNAKGFRLSRALLEFLTVCGTVKEQPKFLHSRKMPSGLQAEFPLPPPL